MTFLTQGNPSFSAGLAHVEQVKALKWEITHDILFQFLQGTGENNDRERYDGCPPIRRRDIRDLLDTG
jgi:hypothetical protein